MQNEGIDDLIKFFTRKCKQHNLKITHQRLVIFKELQKSNNHPTADKIFQTIKTDYPNISFDTINRTLLTFARIGIVNIVESYTGARRYDQNVNKHHHIHCVKCSDIIDFHYADYDRIEVPKEIERQYSIINTRVIFNVICAKCRNGQ